MNAALPIRPVAPVFNHAQPNPDAAAAIMMPWPERLAFLRKLRIRVAEDAERLAERAASVAKRPLAEKLVSEVLPLADACRWLERHARHVLRPRRSGSTARPLWLFGSSFEVHRQPLGRILIIGPRNYPLFLPGVQVLHALAAGNKVLLKPAPGTSEVAEAFAELCFACGMPRSWLTVLVEDIEVVEQVVSSGVDKVVFTGSSENGRQLLRLLARTNTPAILELSGDDPLIVLDDANVSLVLQAIRFGIELNAGETCMAPRRLILLPDMFRAVVPHLTPEIQQQLRIESVKDDATAVARANASPYGLGASIFSSNIGRAQRLAMQLRTGVVLINDMIVPTADPCLPFGGIKASGYGVTRGVEGLLEMTAPHVVITRRRNLRHLQGIRAEDASFFAGYLRAVHGRGGLTGIFELLGFLAENWRKRRR